MKKIIFLFLGILISGCSNLSKNTIESGTFYIRNGVKADKAWKEDLRFKRYSFSHELTLLFELMIADIDPQSSFNFWFSKDELDTVQKCSDAKIVLAYSLDTVRIPYFYLNDQLSKSGYERFDLIEFSKELNAHSDSVMNSMRLYKVFGICKKTKDLRPITISFPGFVEKTLN
jgi:hypothetical protein